MSKAEKFDLGEELAVQEVVKDKEDKEDAEVKSGDEMDAMRKQRQKVMENGRRPSDAELPERWAELKLPLADAELILQGMKEPKSLSQEQRQRLQNLLRRKNVTPLETAAIEIYIQDLRIDREISDFRLHAKGSLNGTQHVNGSKLEAGKRR